MAGRLLIDDGHALFSRNDLHYAEFPSDYLRIRYYTLLLVKNSRLHTDDRLLLEQQVSELLKNAIKHGNGCDQGKIVRVWYRFDEREARIIVEDEGSGFADIEKWNLFNELRHKYIEEGDYTALMNYASWRTAKSDRFDGGNAMFAAIEYWNSGVVYTSRRNAVAAGKSLDDDMLGGGDE